MPYDGGCALHEEHVGVLARDPDTTQQILPSLTAFGAAHLSTQSSGKATLMATTSRSVVYAQFFLFIPEA